MTSTTPIVIAGIAAACLASLVAAPQSAELPETDKEEAIEIEGAPRPCAERYTLAAAPDLAASTSARSLRAAFRAERDWGLEQNVTFEQAPDGTPAMAVRYPKGSINPGNDKAPLGGAGFYSKALLPEGTEAACLLYRVFFPQGFAFAKGGKLPGLYGGEGASGGDQAKGDDGFSMRFMWREDGAGELYEYVVNTDADYGLSVGRGIWKFPTGRWIELQLEVILNDPGSANGIARVWVDGVPMIEQTDLAYRTVGDIRIEGLHFITFFGGHDRSWASPKDQKTYFADIRTFVAQRQLARSDGDRG